MVVQTLPSGTRCISSITSLQIEKVISPIRFTAAPSTKRSIEFNVTGCPAFKASNILGAPSGSNPTIFVAGENVLKKLPTPALKPPPPTGTKT